MKRRAPPAKIALILDQKRSEPAGDKTMMKTFLLLLSISWVAAATSFEPIQVDGGLIKGVY